jgi:hypothetical protein
MSILGVAAIAWLLSREPWSDLFEDHAVVVSHLDATHICGGSNTTSMDATSPWWRPIVSEAKDFVRFGNAVVRQIALIC